MTRACQQSWGRIARWQGVRRCSTSLLLATALGCSVSPDSDAGFGEGMSAPSTAGSQETSDGDSIGSTATSESGSGDASSTRAEGGDDNSDGSVLLDVAGPPGNPDGSACTQVDFLFVVDNSGSMADEQETMAANIPAFIEGISGTLESVDGFHVGVVTSDEYRYEQVEGEGFDVNPVECQKIGALVTETPDGGPCGPYAEGNNFMTEADDLDTAFSCAVQVGTGSAGLELSAAAMEAAVRGDHDNPGDCNEGFMQDNALLVVVIVSDEWDGPGDPENTPIPSIGIKKGTLTSPGDPISWFETVVASKGGVESNVVMLTLTHGTNSCEPNFEMGELPGGGLEALPGLFTNGFHGCIDGDFSEIFSEALEVVSTACTNFTPVG